MPGYADNPLRTQEEAEKQPRDLSPGTQAHGIPLHQGSARGGAALRERDEDPELAEEEALLMNAPFPEEGTGYGGTELDGQSAANATLDEDLE